ncbi:hypothetical protein G7076_06520 [Sphingomonas sp. HDW15A]|uniref:I78 family peptidase inhibitor n=1 Tax=Sphingomonas sp. HDW15A TaxID=2714942 RepID=UPI0014098815|nr:I78 family peptidase inhibitor [Sphingomonas sp. HDW15A]QIK96149.1 hypothetical protein G7076_06520 [Sphingomonas sp. HDW15A]
MHKSKSLGAYAALGFVPLSLLVFASCSTTAQPVPPSSPGGALCTADQLNRFKGLPATPELGAEIRKASGARIFRWLPKGTIITMEYNADRVNVHLDEANRVERARCG